jgi:phosphopantothenoylcysteine decarboxylase / phosphopantothenate---cysteine ligase
MSLKNKLFLVTAGPTHEPIDPVRYIANRSSGKMGYAIAEVLAGVGASVHLVSGPVNLFAKHQNIVVKHVKTADEMYKACVEIFPKVNGAIMAAAVADYTPVECAVEKIKKSGEKMTIRLKKTQDIAKKLGEMKNPGQVLTGFALETENEIENATRKKEEKNMDIIVLNSLRNEGAGFQTDTNKVSVIDLNNNIHNFELKSKQLVAKDIVNFIIKQVG